MLGARRCVGAIARHNGVRKRILRGKRNRPMSTCHRGTTVLSAESLCAPSHGKSSRYGLTSMYLGNLFKSVGSIIPRMVSLSAGRSPSRRANMPTSRVMTRGDAPRHAVHPLRQWANPPAGTGRMTPNQVTHHVVYRTSRLRHAQANPRSCVVEITIIKWPPSRELTLAPDPTTSGRHCLRCFWSFFECYPFVER